MKTGTNESVRLAGLDLARFFAFAGMVIVNFRIVMGAENDQGTLALLTGVLEGRAAATFVVLAGLGLGLANIKSDHRTTVSVTLRRAIFLLVLGLLNALVFEADILHYYAFYFLFGVALLRLQSHALVTLIVLLNVAFVLLVIMLDYEHSWNWSDYSYADFWTPVGFVRNLFFNGFHPVIPWLSFLLFGFLLSRTSLSKVSLQNRLIISGLLVMIAAELFSLFIADQFHSLDPELIIFAATKPMPPMPLYVLAGGAAAALMIGLCLRFAEWIDRVGMLKIIASAGRQTLTLYIAHILIGMGTLEALGMLGGQSIGTAVTAALLFCVLAISYAFAWSKFFKRGPLEAVMRKLSR
ncbi:MAG: transporter [Woeseia sp.]|nr:transporter [Woeseia sp.]|tara:strand:+ start:3031 stop:4089 length:1059 start_codon:yes stop_codon:yes gene_type:complete